MRPIDAERLDRIMTSAAVNGKNSHLGVWKKAICLVHDAPTVNITDMDTLAQLAKWARWVKRDGLYGYECSRCGCSTGFDIYLFCPFCGARMNQT